MIKRDCLSSHLISLDIGEPKTDVIGSCRCSESDYELVCSCKCTSFESCSYYLHNNSD